MSYKLQFSVTCLESNIKRKLFVGHSVGEMGCAYADGCLTAEEMVLSAYFRGLVSVETPFIQGSMAAVGLGYQQVKQILMFYLLQCLKFAVSILATFFRSKTYYHQKLRWLATMGHNLAQFQVQLM